jgi:hypothetical protein
VEARGAREIDDGMRRRGLVGALARARGYAPFSRTRARPKSISIIPYSSPDPQSRFVGGLGISEGEPASGVIVELDGTAVVKVTTLDYIGGEYSEREIPVTELVGSRLETLIERREREQLDPDISVDTASRIALNAFNVLLTDEHSQMVHTREDIQGLIYNAPVVNLIAELQYMRSIGVAASPGTSCCCCCSCCWGSCSTCSAVSTAYLNRGYYAISDSQIE